MRVIAGTYRSRLLQSPRGTATRPTSDRLRETLFNILSPRIPNSQFADLYAGTGAVGIEALSRGAAHVFFAENAAPALAALRTNLAALKINRKFTLEDRGTGALLQHLAKSTSPSALTSPDIIFLDPPYDSASEYESTLAFLGSARGVEMLNRGVMLVPGGAFLAPRPLIIAEHSSKSPLPARFGFLEQYRHLKQGDAALTFYHLPSPTDESIV